MIKMISITGIPIDESPYGKTLASIEQQFKSRTVKNIILDLRDESITIILDDDSRILGEANQVINYNYNGLKF